MSIHLTDYFCALNERVAACWTKRPCDSFLNMKLTAVFEPAKEGGYTCFVEEIPAAISQGETLEEAKANLLDALKLVLKCQRELAEKELSPQALREPIEIAGT
jgi:predicted RNase H-like HicB family nuclease